MKPISKTIRLVAGLGLLWAAAGCDKYQGPAAIYDPNAPLGAFPEIRAVEPALNAEAGVFRIVIRGRNFAKEAARNSVYFDNTQALIQSCTDTAIVVYRPAVAGDSLTIKVLVEGAVAFGKYPGYGVAEAARLYGKLPTKNIVQLLAVDKNENLYALKITKDIIRLSTDEYQSPFGMRTFRAKAMDMKAGPDGGMYLQPQKAKQLYRIPPEGGDTEPYANFAAAAHYFDFDRNGNIFGGGEKTGISVILPDLTSRVVGDGSDLTVTGLRVYNDGVYVTEGTAIWRLSIMDADGSLASKTKVFDITAQAGYEQTQILSFAFSEEGNLFVSINHADAVLIVYPDGSMEPLYKGILPASGGQLVWGNGNYLYLNMTESPKINDILRIDTGVQGAPNEGLQ
jgi:hypothetical protein